MRPAHLGMPVTAMLITAMLALSCATRPPAPATPPLSIVWSAVEVRGTGIETARIDALVTLSNTGTGPVVVDSVERVLRFDEAITATVRDDDPVRLEPGASAGIPLRFDFQVPAGTEPLVPLRLESRAMARAAGGAAELFTAEARVAVPRVLAPSLDISSIRIIKDELINTRLRVDLAIHNPNAFALSFATLDFRLYGEGRYWAEGSQPQPFEVPAGGEASASLFLTMNFTDMSRSLLDQVIRLASVNYRLAGAARVDTGLDFLPQFVLPFDLSGRAVVTR